MTILVAERVSKQIHTGTESIQILNNISFTVKKKETVAILGPSGSGKSTLLGLLAGLDIPSSGEIELLGFALNQLTEEARAQVRLGKVGFIFQFFHLLPNLTALENVMLPLTLSKTIDAKKRAENSLHKVGLKERLNHFPKQLSGGEQQRVAIARAYVTSPQILFADEPTGNLDNKTAAKIIDLLFETNQTVDTTLIVVTHDAEIANRCEKIIKLESGMIL